MWSFVVVEGGVKIGFPDGSSTTILEANKAVLVNEYLETAIQYEWPQKDSGITLVNPIAGAFHDIFKFMTPDGMNEYDKFPEAIKLQKANPYIKCCLGFIYALKGIPLLEQAARPLWGGEITVAGAVSLSDNRIKGGYSLAWKHLSKQ